MPYIGRAATNTGNVRYLDNVASGFDGSDVTFTAQVGGVSITPDQENVRIYLDGVFQHPGSGNAYTISGSTITFTEAPVANTVFSAYVVGAGSYLDDKAVSSAKLDDDAVTAAKLDDDGTGFQVGDLGVGGSLTSGDKLTVTGRARVSGGIIGDVTGDLTGDVTGNTSGSSGSTTGNAATATALATARAINGVNFDGSAAITVTAASGTLSGSTLASGVTASSLTSVGTLTSLTLGGDLNIPEYIKHIGDTDTFIRFIDGGIAFSCDNTTPLVLDATGGTGMAVGGNATFAGTIICNKHMAVGGETAISSWEDTDNEFSALHLGNAASVFGSGSGTTNSQAYLATNTYYNGAWKRIGAGEASMINLNDDGHMYFFHAAADAGTAGADGAITFSQSLKLDVNGTATFAGTIASGSASNVGIGTAQADANSTEVGQGYINLARDDTADAKQIQFTKNGSVHSYIETTTNALVISSAVQGGNVEFQGYTTTTGNIYTPGDLMLQATGQSDWGVDNDSGSYRVYRSGTGASLTLDTSLNATFAAKVQIGASSSDSMVRIRQDSTQTAPNNAATALTLSGYSSATQFGGGIGWTWNDAGSGIEPACWLGTVAESYSGHTQAALVLATRNTTNNTAPTERMRITSGGQLLLGSTNTNPWEDTSGDGSFIYHQGTGSRNTGIAMSTDASVGYSMFYLNMIDGANAERYFAFYRNDTQIGTVSLNGTGNVTYNTSSDYRLKENIEPMTGSIARLKQIKPSTFNFISEPDRSCEGFIAHELAEIVPNAVSGEKDAMRDDGVKIDPQGVDFGRVVPLLVSAVQELTAKVEALENA